jgi:hypothetical protein
MFVIFLGLLNVAASTVRCQMKVMIMEGELAISWVMAYSVEW